MPLLSPRQVVLLLLATLATPASLAQTSPPSDRAGDDAPLDASSAMAENNVDESAFDPDGFDSGAFDPDAFDPDAFDNLEFDDSALLSDDLFDDSASNGSGSTNPLRYQLTQQWVGHLNRHSYESVNTSDANASTLPDHRPHQSEVNRLAAHIRYQNAFAGGWLAQASAWGRVYLDGDYEHENSDRSNIEWRLNEFFLQRSSSRDSITAGRQTVVWGETIGLSVLDVVNTTEYRDLTVIDLEDARLNQWMIGWDRFSESGNFSSFINLYPEFNPLPVDGSPLFPGSHLRLSSYHRDEAIFEFGTRWQRHFTGSDLSLMAARLYENNLLHLPDSDSPLRSQPQVNDYLLLGGSINRAIDTLLLTLDVAWSKQIQVAAMPAVQPAVNPQRPFPPLDEPQLPVNVAGLYQEKVDLIGISTGFEYAITPLRQISVGLRAEKLLNLPDTNVVIIDNRTDLRADALLRYSHIVWEEVLSLALTAQADLKGDANLINLSAEYQWNDNFSTTAQLIATRGKADSNFALLDEDLRLGLTMTLSF